jgi:hypothetical protein
MQYIAITSVLPIMYIFQYVYTFIVYIDCFKKLGQFGDFLDIFWKNINILQ